MKGERGGRRGGSRVLTTLYYPDEAVLFLAPPRWGGGGGGGGREKGKEPREVEAEHPRSPVISPRRNKKEGKKPPPNRASGCAKAGGTRGTRKQGKGGKEG